MEIKKIESLEQGLDLFHEFIKEANGDKDARGRYLLLTIFCLILYSTLDSFEVLGILETAKTKLQDTTFLDKVLNNGNRDDITSDTIKNIYLELMEKTNGTGKNCQN